MGVEFLGGLASGVAQGWQKQQEMAITEDYKKALIEANKAEAKHKEKQIELLTRKQGLQDQMMQTLMQRLGGGGVGMAPPMQTPPGIVPQAHGMAMQPMAAPQGQPQALTSGGQVEQMIVQEAIRQGVDPQLALKIAKQESGYRMVPGAKGEIGIFQLMPGTAQEMGIQNPHDPAENIRGGVGYLRKQLERFKDVPSAIAAYNAGPENIAKRGIINPQYVSAINYQGPGLLPQQIAAQQMGQGMPQPLGQTKGDISQLPYQDRMLLDMLMHQTFDKFDPKLREAGKKTVKQRPDGGWDVINEEGIRVATLPPSVQMQEPYEYTDIYGNKRFGYRPKNVYLGEPGGVAPGRANGTQAIPGGMISPGPLSQVKGMSEAEQKEFRQTEESLKSVRAMIDFAGKPENKNAFGYWAATRHNIYQNPESLPKALVRGFGEITGVIKPPTESIAAFHAKLEEFNSAIRYNLYAGNLTPAEAERYQKQAAAATTPEQFLAVAKVLEEKINNKLQSLKEAGGMPQVYTITRPTPELESLKNKGPLKVKPDWVFDPKSGKWVKP